jgi:hypothetical protein
MSSNRPSFILARRCYAFAQLVTEALGGVAFFHELLEALELLALVRAPKARRAGRQGEPLLLDAGELDHDPHLKPRALGVRVEVVVHLGVSRRSRFATM